ncbi:hypothetical protein [Rhizobium sp. RU36D]|uniref:hypothetical protein n=1 Tax=Rhizobium sp. RU36D TaxID=1907415 RepID=UPI0009D806A0|nr:hypothetical protein [Rhizobium sp. RU36D]SMD18091.1 hypothetical protein SAMN05880593_13416 [Rhizobium sp. RU36D]
MLIHHYHPLSGEFICSSTADKSPLEPGVFLIPAHATKATPPVVAVGYLRVFRNGVWGYVPETEPDTPPTPEPEPVDPLTAPLSRLAFWLAAAEIGVTKSGIRSRIDAIPDDLARLQAIAYLDDAQIYRRNDPLLTSMAEAEGIAASELDSLWAWAVATYA